MTMDGDVEFEIHGKVLHPPVGEELFIPAGVVHSVRNHLTVALRIQNRPLIEKPPVPSRAFLGPGRYLRVPTPPRGFHKGPLPLWIYWHVFEYP